MANLFNILEREGSPEQIGSALRPLIRRNNEAGSDIKKSLHELETIINYAQSLGVKAKIIISPGLIFQSEHFSGMICQLFANLKRKKRGTYEILAGGGRFDSLISSFASRYKKFS